jgi:nicotinamide-nucleotide amidase
MQQLKAGIVVTGTEVLTARITDANGPWLSEALRSHGFDVTHITICRDRASDIRAQLDFLAGQGVDLICTTGGLGPTADDLTAAVVAEFCARPLRLDEPTLETINEIVAGFAARMNFDQEALAAGSRKQAMVPEEAAILGPAGTAPGLVVTPAPGTTAPVVIVLPGPPGELQKIWEEAIETASFRELCEKTFVFEEQTIRMIAIPESDIAKSLRDFEAERGLGELEITTCLRKGEMEILISHRPDERDLRDALVAAFRSQYGDAIFSESEETVDQQIVRLLDGRTLALAESCTGGLLAERLTRARGASRFFKGSAVTYSNDAKARVLSVPEAELEDFGAVSPEVARSMCEGALAAFDSDFSVSITGIAGPAGGAPDKPVGTVEFHACSRDGRSRSLGIVLPGQRRDVQERAATVALHLVRQLLVDPS